MRTSLICVTLVVFLIAAGTLPAAPRPSVGFATGDYPFLIEKTEVYGNGSLLAGEGVSTSYLPVRLHLTDGSEFVLGIGSFARVFEDRIVLDGVSLDVARPSESPRTVEVAGLNLVLAPSTKASIYSDRADAVSVAVTEGSVDVRNASGAVIRRMASGDAALISDTRDDVRIQEREAAGEVARIQARQIEFMGELEKEVPTVSSKRNALKGLLAGVGAGGALAMIGGGSPAMGTPSGNLAGATSAVSNEINQGQIDQTGCGNSGCEGYYVPVSTQNIYYGRVIGIGEPYPGCTLCYLATIGAL